MSIKVNKYERKSLAPARFVMPPEEAANASWSPIAALTYPLAAELRRVGWDVPDLDVRFTEYGHGRNRAVWLSEIRGHTEDGPFKLNFGASTEKGPRFHFGGELSHAVIPPGIDINFFSDRSGPAAVLYVGDDWKRDGDAFMADLHVNSKLRKEPKTYLKYSGHGSSILRHDHDLNREYSPDEGRQEPVQLHALDVAEQVSRFVDTLLARLKALPSKDGHDDLTPFGDANFRALTISEPTPVPAGTPPLFTWVEGREVVNATGRHEEVSELGDDDYALAGIGWRLVPHVPEGAPKVPEAAWDGFNYALPDPHGRTEFYHGDRRSRSDSYPVRIDLKFADHIYVVDDAVYERYRNDMSQKIQESGRDRFTDREVDLGLATLGATMVPLAEYDGSYGNPIYLIGRQLNHDEARAITGEVKLEEKDGEVAVSLTDEASGQVFEIYSGRSAPGPRRTARQRAHEVVRLCHGVRPVLRDLMTSGPDAEPDLGSFLSR